MVQEGTSQVRAQKKRRQTYAILGATAVVVVLAMAGIAVSHQREIESAVAVTGSGADEGPYTSLSVSATGDGLYRLGSPDAPVLLEVVSSFTCPHCAHFHQTIHGLIDPYVKDGTLAVIAYPLGNSSRAALGTAAAICAGQQEPAKFWEMSDLMFSWINQAYDRPNIEEAADAMGLDVAALAACMDSPETAAIMQSIYDEAMARQVWGTPATFFNGERPDCGIPGDTCEGNLPFDMVVQNIERHLN